jgi:L-asparaginase II
MSDQLRVESVRGDLVESVHRVSVAVVDASGRMVASAGSPERVTFWRSAAKPFQAVAVVADGAADRYAFDGRDLALMCASHSSETAHIQVAESMLRKVGVPEQALACGPHPPLSSQVYEHALRHGLTITPRWSNCSGKHAGMLALAQWHDWPLIGYERAEHPVQRRILAEVERWTDVPADRMRFGVDGCTVVCFGLPLQAMALAYARFAATTEPAMVRLRSAMAAHPHLIAGTGRICTDLNEATVGAVLAKVGADGIHCAAIPAAGLGIALKVADGDMRSSGPALLAVLRQLARQGMIVLDLDHPPAALARHVELPTVNTRGAVTGTLRAAGAVRFSE